MPGLNGKTKRQEFIIKVYSILTLKLTVTFGIVLASVLVPSKCQ